MLSWDVRILAALPVFALAVSGCVDPEGVFNDFTDRQKALVEAGTDAGNDAEAGVEAGPCDPPAAGDLDGKYLFALSASLKPKLPVLFLADLKSVAYTDGGAAVGLAMTLQSLDAKDRKTPVGDPLVIPTLGIDAEGYLQDTQLPDIAVDGAANSIQPGLAIVASVALHGQICGVQDFYCGAVSGKVSSPITIDLVNSTYTFQLVTDSANLPAPLINCAKAPADPPPT